MADAEHKKRTFRTYSYRGIDLDKLLTMKLDEVVELLPARKRRKIARGCLNRRTAAFIAKLRKSKAECPMGEKPVAVRTHLRNMVILPEMVGSVAGVYNDTSYTPFTDSDSDSDSWNLGKSTDMLLFWILCLDEPLVSPTTNWRRDSVPAAPLGASLYPEGPARASQP
ncbi:40S ribosomal protein S15 [Cryptosporidium canis]|nr:40S ribosomal protein S15 [Cryptosporidium canis]